MYFLGVDSGGTATKAVLTDLSAQVFRTSKEGPCNVSVLGIDRATEVLQKLLNSILKEDKVSKIEHATFGLAGCGKPRECKAITEAISTLGLQQFCVLPDSEILHYSFFQGDNGVMIASGTGSVSVFIDESRNYRKLGGWGYLLGDEGSGFAIGRSAFRIVAEEEQTGLPLSKFASALLTFYGCKTRLDLLSSVYHSSNPQNHLASCAAIISDLANKGEANASRIIDGAIDSLIELTLKTIDSSKLTEKPIRIALSGSVLAKSSYINRLYKDRLKKHFPQHDFVKREYEPAAAAALHSLHLGEKPVSAQLAKKLKQVNF